MNAPQPALKNRTLQDIGQWVVEVAQREGATDATAHAARSAYPELHQRDGRLEKCDESRSLSVSVALLVDDRYSIHTSSDLRPEPLQAFIQRAIEATGHLEQDPIRRLADRSDMGMADVGALEALDPDAGSVDPEVRRTSVRPPPTPRPTPCLHPP